MPKATRHSAMLVVAYLITSVVNYAFGVALSWFFLPEQYGVLGVAQSILLLVALVAGSGFTWTVAHDIASQGITEATRRRLQASFLLNTLVGLLLAVGLWLAYTTGALPLGSAYTLIVPLVGVTTVVLSARSIINGILRGQSEFTNLAINLVGEVVVKAVAGIALVAAGWGVAGVLAGFILGAAASLVHSFWVTRKTRWWKPPLAMDWSVIRSTAPLFLGMMGTALMLNLDVLGLKLFSAPGQSDTLAGLYQAAVILARTPVFIAQALTLVLFTYAASGKGNYVINSVNAWARLLLPAGLALILAPQAALGLFFPVEYHSAVVPLQVASAGCLALALVTLLTGVYQAEGKRLQPALAAGGATLVQVAALAYLVPRYGALGAGASLIIAAGVALVLLSPLIVSFWRKELRLKDVRQKWLVGGLKTLIPLLILAAALLMLPDGNRAVSLLKFVLAGLAYLVALVMVRLRVELRQAGKPQPFAHLISQFVQVLMGG